MRTLPNRDGFASLPWLLVGHHPAMSEWDDPFEDFSSDWPVLVGVWADRTQVHRGRGEFTVDFVRLVPRPAGRALVSRAIIAPHVALDLRDQLDEAWQDYNRWSMPGAES